MVAGRGGGSAEKLLVAGAGGIPFGGPDIYTRRELTELAFRALADYYGRPASGAHDA